MIEGFADQIPEKEMGDAIMFAHKHIRQLCDLQEELAKELGIAPVEIPEPAENPFEQILEPKRPIRRRQGHSDETGSRRKSSRSQNGSAGKVFPE